MAFSEAIFEKMIFLHFPPHNDEFSLFLHKKWDLETLRGVFEAYRSK